MKSIPVLLSIIAVGVFSLAPTLRAEDACCSEVSSAQLQRRLREIDLKVYLAMYEECRREAGKAELALSMLPSDPGASDEQKKQQIELLQNRREVMVRNADRLRERILALGKELEVAAK